jgi:acyl carrier protein
MDNEIFKRIKEFTVEETGVRERNVTETASLENDLGIYGGDGVDYITAFSKRFDVNISKFMAADYFSNEGVDFVTPIVELFTGKEGREKKSLTIGHLVKAVEAGRLDDEIINS